MQRAKGIKQKGKRERKLVLDCLLDRVFSDLMFFFCCFNCKIKRNTDIDIDIDINSFI